MNENQLVDAMINAPIPPLATDLVDPIAARGYGSLKVPALPSLPSSPSRPNSESQVFPLETTTASATNSSLQGQQVFMDYSQTYKSYTNHEKSEKVIPNYRLATSCANCAFSTYDPVQGEAHCQKWKVCVTPFYVCDNHLDPCTLARSQENFSKGSDLKLLPLVQIETETETESVPVPATEVDSTAVSITKYVDMELYVEALTLTPSFDVEGLEKLFSEKKYQQLFKAKYGENVSPYKS